MVKRLNKKRIFITFVLIFILSFSILLIKLNKNKKNNNEQGLLDSIKLKVLLITSEDILESTSLKIRNNTVFGLYNHFNHEQAPVFMDYLDILSSNNIPYDIFIYKDGNLKMESLIKDKILKYSVIIIAMPFDNMFNSSINTIKNSSMNYGVSIISSYDYLDPRINDIFGISKVLGDEESTEIRIDGNFSITEELEGLTIKNEYKSKIKKIMINKDVKIVAYTFPGLSPVVITKRYGNATNYYFAIEQKGFLEDFNVMHNLVRNSIVENSGYGMAFFNLKGNIILRMDDPGTSIKIYSDYCHFPELNGNDWEGIFDILDKYNITLNIGYNSGWVDDGNTTRGTLYINKTKIGDRNRVCGKIYDSRDVFYIDKEGWLPRKEWDYANEYKYLLNASIKNLVDIEAHGYSHITPKLILWCKSTKYFSNWWKVELGDMENDDYDTTPSYNEQKFIIEKASSNIKKWFNKSPTTMIPPCHRRSYDTDVIAKEEGFKLVSSNILTIIKNHTLIRNDKIIAVPLSDIKENHLNSGYPIIWFFHDLNISNSKSFWLEKNLKKLMENNSVKKIITLRELNGYLNSVIKASSYYNKLCVAVDISNTGGTKNEIQSRYFYDHNMELIVKIPEKKDFYQIFVDDKIYSHFDVDYVKNELKINLPKFHRKDKQHICIYFK